MCDAINIGNTQQTLKKEWMVISPIYNVYSRTDKNQDSFAAHFVQHFNTTTSRTDLRKYMTFKVVNQLNPIGAMKKITKPNCNLCMEEHLTILKKLREKLVTVVNKNSDIYGPAARKRFCVYFFIITYDPIFNG